jgi:hypothetical protein
MLANALESHWNKLEEDEEYRKEVNRRPGQFRLRCQ